MKKYEYLNVTYYSGLKGPAGVTQFCNEYGEKGWDMVNFFYVPEYNLMCFIFKREID